jgi:hypothetical protein
VQVIQDGQKKKIQGIDRRIEIQGKMGNKFFKNNGFFIVGGRLSDRLDRSGSHDAAPEAIL